jgi:hypothetical protein
LASISVYVDGEKLIRTDTVSPVQEMSAMLNRVMIVGFSLAIVIATSVGSQQDDSPVPDGPYFDQTPPGMTPEIFAPGIVSSEHQEHSSLSISPDGKEMWWSRWRLPHDLDKYPQAIVFIKYDNGAWSQPEVAPFSGRHRDGSPAFSPDGNKIFFYSRRPLDNQSDEMHDNDIWYVEETPDGWGRPINLGSTVNTSAVEATPWLTANGNLYFTSNRVQYEDPTGNSDIFVSEYSDTGYTEPKGLGPNINTPYARDAFPFVAPDESYIIFSRDDRRFDDEGNVIDGERLLVISFKDDDGEWQEAVDTGDHFAKTRFPSVSPDGKYFFFTKYTEGGNEDFYWVDAKVISTFKSLSTVAH